MLAIVVLATSAHLERHATRADASDQVDRGDVVTRGAASTRARAVAVVADHVKTRASGGDLDAATIDVVLGGLDEVPCEIATSRDRSVRGSARVRVRSRAPPTA